MITLFTDRYPYRERARFLKAERIEREVLRFGYSPTWTEELRSALELLDIAMAFAMALQRAAFLNMPSPPFPPGAHPPPPSFRPGGRLADPAPGGELVLPSRAFPGLAYSDRGVLNSKGELLDFFRNTEGWDLGEGSHDQRVNQYRDAHFDRTGMFPHRFEWLDVPTTEPDHD